MRSARSLVRRPRRVISGWLGFPPTQAAVNVLKKLTMDAIDIPRLLYLRTGLHDDVTRKALSHLPTINSGAIRIATDPELLGFVTPSMLREVAGDEAENGTGLWAAYLLKDAVRMSGQLGTIGPRKIRSLEALRAFHDDTTETFNRRPHRREWLLNSSSSPIRSPWPETFPEAPIPGAHSMVPLSRPKMLEEEGRLMDHCAASYTPDVAGGSAYFYRVERPERATLMLRNTSSGWKIAELKGPSNRTVSRMTQQRVSRWLRESGVQQPLPF